VTPLDEAHVAAEADGGEAARLRFWERLAEAELHLLLAAPAEEGVISPRLFEVGGERIALAFDTAERLAAFTGPAPFAQMSGRRLAALLFPEGLGLGLNLEEHPSAQIVPTSAVAWFAQRLEQAPAELEARIESVAPPAGLPDALLSGLDAKLGLMAGLAPVAYLVSVSYEGGGRTHLLAFVDAVPGAEPDLARAVGEALTFSGLEAGSIDLAFPSASDPLSASLARHGLKIQLPVPAENQGSAVGAPGADLPPRLR
jgi:hypothetical protein